VNPGARLGKYRIVKATESVAWLGLTGRNVKRLPEPLVGSGSNLVKFGEV